MLSRRFITRFYQWCVCIIYIHLRIIEMSKNKIYHMVLPIKDSCTYKIYSFIQCTCRKDKITVFSSTLCQSVHTSNNRFKLEGHDHLMCVPKSSMGTNYILDLINLKRGDQFQPAPSKPKLIRV